jgi:hypothetical protein
MNLHHEQPLETAVDRELKALPHLRAPSSLASRVMAKLEQPASLPWYRRDWQTWPLPLQAVSLLVLLVAFAGVCSGSWQIIHTPVVASVIHNIGGWLNALNVIWKTAGVLINAGALAFTSLGTWVIAGCLAMLALGYATCLGLGTIYFRLAFARR